MADESWHGPMAGSRRDLSRVPRMTSSRTWSCPLQGRATKGSKPLALHAAARTVDLSLERYKAGTVEFMTVIDAGREHFEIEQAWARSKGLVLKTLIRLGR